MSLPKAAVSWEPASITLLLSLDIYLPIKHGPNPLVYLSVHLKEKSKPISNDLLVATVQIMARVNDHFYSKKGDLKTCSFLV